MSLKSKNTTSNTPATQPEVLQETPAVEVPTSARKAAFDADVLDEIPDDGVLSGGASVKSSKHAQAAELISEAPYAPEIDGDHRNAGGTYTYDKKGNRVPVYESVTRTDGTEGVRRVV